MLPRADQSRSFENAGVFAHSRTADRKALRQVTGTLRSTCQSLQDFSTSRIRQRSKGPVQSRCHTKYVTHGLRKNQEPGLRKNQEPGPNFLIFQTVAPGAYSQI